MIEGNNVQKIIALAGNKHRYQIVIISIIFLLWLNCTMFNYSLPFLENTPSVSYYDTETNETIVESMSYEICDWKENNYTIVETFNYSWVIDLNIPCEKFQVSFLGTLTSLGFLLGAISYSFINKLLGLKKTFFFSMVCFMVFMVIAIFVNYYAYYCVAVVLIPTMCNIMEYSTMVFNTEIIAPDKKTITNAIISSGMGFGGIVYILLYWFIGDWKYVFVFCISLTAVLSIIMFFLLMDSPYGVIAQGDIPKFLNMMRFIARFNGRLDYFNKEIMTDKYQLILKQLHGEKVEEPLKTESDQIMIPSTPMSTAQENPPKELDAVEKEHKKDVNNQSDTKKENGVDNDHKTGIQNEESNNHHTDEQGIRHNQTNVFESPKVELNQYADKAPVKKASYSPWTLLKYPSLRYTFLLLCLLWFCTAALFSGLTIGIKSLPGSIYVNGIILYCAEVPAYYTSGFLINTKFGRKKTLMLFTAGFSILCILLVIVFNYDTPTVVIYIITRYFVMSAFCIYYTYCLESYPISVGSMAYGINGSCNSLGSAVVPFIVEYINRRVLYGIYAGLGVICTLLMILLKETQGQAIPTDIKELELEKKEKELDHIPVVVV